MKEIIRRVLKEDIGPDCEKQFQKDLPRFIKNNIRRFKDVVNLMLEPKKEDFKNFLGKNYSLYRTFNIADQSANPHRLLIEYEVRLADPKTANDYPNQENVIAKSSVEVIPDASFKCP